MTEPAIRVENLSKLYRIGLAKGRHDTLRDQLAYSLRNIGQRFTSAPCLTEDALWALWDVSFEVQPGEAVGIIGRNGAGKSTLLKILSRITEPTSGRAVLNGRVGSLLEVGTGFHPELTGRENIYLNGAILGMHRTEIERKFDEIVAFSGIERFLNTPVKRYSSGMYVRLAFAVASHLEPEILIVDEVLAVGDAEFQKKCLGKMGAVADEGRTVLFVSHNLPAVANLCKNGILLNNGRIETHESMQETIKKYLFNNHQNEKDTIEFETEEIHLINMRAYQDTNSSNLFLTDKPLIIQFDYEIKNRIIHGLRIGFDLHTIDGIIIFRSFDDDILELPERTKGRYQSQCHIPAGFFYPNDFFIFPRIGIHNKKWLSDTETRIKISFEHVSGVNQKYADKRPGVIMPALNWSVMTND